MTKTEKQKVGDKGEEIAISYIKKNGFKILDRNYMRPWGELDIVAQKDNIIHFIEVKTLSVHHNNIDEYDPFLKIDGNKKKRLNRIIETYLSHKNLYEEEYQVDALAVYITKNEENKVEFLEDILL